MKILKDTPKQLGYRFPAEWELQSATWLSWAHKLESWPDKFEPIPYVYTSIVKTISRFQHVNINVTDDTMYEDVLSRQTTPGAEITDRRLSSIPLRQKRRQLSTGDTTPGVENIRRSTWMMSCRRKLPNCTTYLFFIQALSWREERSMSMGRDVCLPPRHASLIRIEIPISPRSK